MEKVKISIEGKEHEVPLAEIEKSLQGVSSVKGESFTIISNDEYSKRFGELHAGYENALEEVTGEQKPQGVKGTDYIKQKAKELFEKSKGFDSEKERLNNEISELKSQIKKGGSDEAIKKQNEQLLADIEARKKEIKDLKESHQKQLSTMESRNAVRGLLADNQRKLKEGVDSNAIKHLNGEIERTALLHGVKVREDGQHVILNEQGTALVDKDQSVITVESMIDSFFSTYKTGKRDGNGTGGGDGRNSDKETSEIPESIKTRVQLNEWMDKEGIKKGSEARMKLVLLAQKSKMPLE